MPNPNTAAVANFQNPDAYEQVMGKWSRRLAPLLIQFGGLSDGDRVLDVGCGTGSLTFTFPEIANAPIFACRSGKDQVEKALSSIPMTSSVVFKSAKIRAIVLSSASCVA
jgi:cyclopropane fatty-acyl-phospholipid synthase-like methyltransferase